MKLLSVQNLVLSLVNGVAVVDDISFKIVAGETFALLGESGCGKSITALSLMRLLPSGMQISAGHITLAGVELTTLPEREMRGQRGNKLAMIFQEPGLSLNPVMTVGEQIAEVLKYHSVSQNDCQPKEMSERAGDIQITQRCIELLQLVGIPDAARRINEYPFQLSGGMKQRVMIAMALAGQPRLLIADEPTTALDVTIQAQVLQLLRETQQQNGMAMLLITHDLGVVAENAHHVGVMYAGQIVEQASRAQLFSKPAHPYTKKLFAALPEASRSGQPLLAIPGNVPPLNNLPAGCRFAPRCDQAWARCHETSPTWTVLADGHSVRCHLYGEEKVEIASLSVPESSSAASSESTNFAQSKLLEVENLQVHFPIRKGLLQRTSGFVKAVDGVSLSMMPGRTLALVGESGCGKTTVGKALLQLIQPTSGSVYFAGQELVGLTKAQLYKFRSGMQMVFQDPFASLNPKMRIAEILLEGMEALNDFGEGISHQQKINQLLQQVGLPQASKWRYPHEFSGGQRQRIAIARALAVNPKLLICDEPTSALDVSVQAQILNLMKSLQQELQLSYLFITHNLAVVEYLAHDVCVMYLGRIVERGTVAEVMRQPRHPYTQALLSSVPRIDGRGIMSISLSGEMPSPANPPSGCHFHPRCPKATDLCRINYPTNTTVSATHNVHCHFI